MLEICVRCRAFATFAGVCLITMFRPHAVIFTEATLHTTLPWNNADHETRRLLYRFTPKYLHTDGGTFTTTQPAWVSELTDVQRAVLEPPYMYSRPELDNEGNLLPLKRRATPDGRDHQQKFKPKM